METNKKVMDSKTKKETMGSETSTKKDTNILSTYKVSLKSQLLKECKVMSEYALTNGLKLPGNLSNILKDASSETNENKNTVIEKDISNQGLHELILIHGQLVDTISPVKPQTLVFLEDEKNKGGYCKFFAPVQIIRHMMLIAIFSLVTMIGISLFECVNGDPKNFSLFETNGVDLLLNEMFLLSAASIGASFSALFSANHYIKRGEFCPSHEASYWIKFVLGLLGGIIIATLVPIENYDPNTGAGALKGFGKPLLALLGGFAAQVVYRILDRLTKALESLFRGDGADSINAKEEALKARITSQSVQNKLALSTKLAELKKKVETSKDSDEIKKGFDQIQSELAT